MPKSDEQDLIEVGFLESVLKRAPDDVTVLRALADLYTHVGRYEDGLYLDLRLGELCPDDPMVWYNLGCSYALVRRPNDALESLAKAVGLGYSDGEWMKKDQDLASLHDDPGFQRILASISTSSGLVDLDGPN